MSKELIRIEPVEYSYRVELSVGMICNYNCPYCIEKSRRGGEWIDMDALINFCNDVSDRNSHRPVTMALANGGEPSMHPRIVEFMQAVKSKPNNIFQLTTNGSQPLKWWEENLKYLDHLVMSFHSTECDHEEFLEKVKYISQRLTMTVVIPLYAPIFYKQYQYGRKLVSECDNVFVSFKPLVSKPYEPEYEWLEEHKKYFMKTPILISEKYDRTKRKAVNLNVRLFYDDGSVEEVRPHLLLAEGKNSFKGWRCHMGVAFLNVDHYGNIYTCCASDHGNIKKEYTIPEEPVICQLNKCNCSFLISLYKEKINDK